MKNPTAKEKQYYKSIGRVWSPALGDYIAFNNIGFTHLIRKHGVLRPKSEQKRRLVLVPDAIDVLCDDNIQPTYQKSDFPNIVHVWKFVGKDKNVKVIVRQFEGGKKHFFSVYGKKQKTARES